MPSIICVSSCPARPTKGSPCASSSAPGPSPTNTSRACSFPEPNTIFDLCSHSRQRRQSPISSWILSSVSSTGASGGSATSGTDGAVGTLGGAILRADLATERSCGNDVLRYRGVLSPVDFLHADVPIKCQLPANLIPMVIPNCHQGHERACSARRSVGISSKIRRAIARFGARLTGIVSPPRSTNTTSFSSDSKPVAFPPA